MIYLDSHPPPRGAITHQEQHGHGRESILLVFPLRPLEEWYEGHKRENKGAGPPGLSHWPAVLGDKQHEPTSDCGHLGVIKVTHKGTC